MYKFLVVFYIFLLLSRTRVVKRRCWGRFGNTCSIYFFFLFPCPLFSFRKRVSTRKQANLTGRPAELKQLFMSFQDHSRDVAGRTDKDLADLLGQREKGADKLNVEQKLVYLAVCRHPHLDVIKCHMLIAITRRRAT